jgi:ABC-type multidrug transport system fused ATPase/permease subunit
LGSPKRETIIDEVIAGISCTPEEISNACESVYRHFALSNEVEKNVWLSRYSLNHEQLQLLATRKLRIEKFKQVNWGNKIDSYFLQSKRNLDKVIYSLIQTKNQNNVNLNLNAGSFVGIVGQSGSGKSTLLKLLPRLYDPKSGAILIDIPV